MPESHPTMIGCPSCAGCLTLTSGPHDHSQYACSVGHSFSLWELYEAKETELERTQWSAMALLMHLQNILEILLDVRDFPDAPDPSKIRQRIGQVQNHIAAVQRMIDSTTLAARETRTAVQSETGGEVQL